MSDSLDADALASWALLGDPAIRPPITLRELHNRIKQAATRHAHAERAAAFRACIEVVTQFGPGSVRRDIIDAIRARQEEPNVG